MVQFLNPSAPAGQYFTVAPSQTTQALGAVGAKGDYIASIIITGTGAITLFDGVTSVLTFTPPTAAPVTIPLGMYSKTGSWNVTTAAATNAVATGQFT